MKSARRFMAFSCTCDRSLLRCTGRYRNHVVTKRLPLALWLIALGVLTQIAGAKNPWKNPTNYSGQFAVLVRGYWHGQGVATVTATTVQITATVSDDDGNTGTLTTDALALTQNHFSGAGTVLGFPLTINGRAEPQDQPAGTGKGKGKNPNGDAVTTSANLEASLQANGHSARIVGARNAIGP